MKREREQILEILEKYDDYILGGDIDEEIADEITLLPFYEKEFTEWLMSSEYFKGKLSEGYLTPVFGLPQADSLDELHKWWTKNVKK